MEMASTSINDGPKLCKRILGLDESIYWLGLVDPLGQVICESLSKTIPEEIFSIETPEELKQGYGSRVAVITSIFKKAEGLLGKSKYVFLAYQRVNVLLVPIKSKNFTIILLISPEGNEKAIAHGILELRDLVNR